MRARPVVWRDDELGVGQAQRQHVVVSGRDNAIMPPLATSSGCVILCRRANEGAC
jgi:hypothetical protein